MTGLNAIVKELSRKCGSINSEDYYKNGLLYCGKCHTPKQCEKTFGDKKMKLNCLCQCEASRKNELRALYASEKEKEDKEYRRGVSIVDRALRGCTFENDQFPQSKIMRYAKRYAERFDEFYKQGIGLCLYGDVGCGKTYAAACIANALIDDGVSVLMTNFSKIVKGMPDMFSGNQNMYFHNINQHKLLIIDDLGIERDTSFMTEQVYTIIDERYKTGKPIILTTNLSWDRDILRETDIAKRRIYDRIIEMCQPLMADGGSKRIKYNMAKSQKAKELFSEC